MTAKEVLNKIIDKCDVSVNGEVISKELLIRTYFQFLASVTEKEEHNVSFVLHTGSKCFDVIAAVYAMATCIAYNKHKAGDVVESLRDGDIVLYGSGKRERYIFRGIESISLDSQISCAILSQEKNGTKALVPQHKWRLIQPYFGNAESLDGRGVHKRNPICEEFYRNVLEYEPEDIPSVLKVSVVLVLQREQVDFLIHNVTLHFNNQELKLLDIITATYFSDNMTEYNYPGNAAGTEAIFKIVSKISVARQLIVSRNCNEHIGIIVFGNETVSRSISELPELLNRRSLKYIHVLMNMDYENVLPLIREVASPNVFLCSKDLLQSYSLPPAINNQYTAELYMQAFAVINRNTTPYMLNGWCSWNEYKLFKKALFSIRNSDIVAEKKEDFIISSCYLMNLFLTSVFKITELNRCISEGTLKILSVEQRINDLNTAITSFPEVIQKKAKAILSFLETSYLYLSEKSEKEDCLKNILIDNSDKRIAVVVPKLYYATVMKKCGYYEIMKDESLLTVVSANNFNNAILYDLIIITGNFTGKRFDSLRCTSAPRIGTLLYDCECNIYRYRMKNARKEIAELNSLNRLVTDTEYKVEMDRLSYSDNASENEIAEIAEIDENIDTYISQLNEIATLRGVESFGMQQGSQNADVIAIGKFDSGENVFFTRLYKAYVFCESEGKVKEINVSELNEGDLLVFTQNTTEARDIVDNVLARLIDEHKVDNNVIECYKLSKQWKQALQKYMRDNDMSAGEIADKMIENGVSVEENTIRGWLDEDSHTVGPREKKSIEQIALLVEDEEMLEHADRYFEACNIIRKIRREILKWIGNAIIDKLNGKTPIAGTVYSDIYDRVDSVAKILCLETITHINRSVPINLTNRPISL